MAWLLADVTKLDSSNAAIYIGLGVAALLYISVIRPMMRRKSDPLDRAPAYASLAQQRATERQMQSLLVDLSEMARQISGQLDSRAAKLEVLIQQADQRLAALQSINAPPIASEALPHVPSILEPVSPPMVIVIPEELPFPEPIDPAHMQIYSLSDDGRNAGEIALEMARPKGEIELILALRGK